MTPDFAIRPMPERACAHQVIIFAESEPVLNLPAGKIGYDDIARQPIRITGLTKYNN